MKKQAAEAAEAAAAAEEAAAVPVEMERFLTDDDFRRIRALQVSTRHLASTRPPPGVDARHLALTHLPPGGDTPATWRRHTRHLVLTSATWC